MQMHNTCIALQLAVASAVASATSNTTPPTPPQAGGKEHLFEWQRQTIAVVCPRPKRIFTERTKETLRGYRAEEVVEWLQGKGFAARIVSVPMTNPLCPWCKTEMGVVADNGACWSWGCESCGSFITKRKERPAPQPGLIPLGQIWVPKSGA